jgi:hypothetical protein
LIGYEWIMDCPPANQHSHGNYGPHLYMNCLSNIVIFRSYVTSSKGNALMN